MSRIVNIMPMAGLGKRFLESIFYLPKPLIQIKDKPMFIQAAKSMPKSNLNIFICNKKLVKQYKIYKILSKEFSKKFKLISVKKTTKGQTNTCLLAKKFLKKNDKIFIHSCDSLIKFKSNNLRSNLDQYEGLIFTTKPNKTHIQNIKSYGWVNLRNNKIHKIACKKKASSFPKKDFVIIGTFAFQNKSTFLKLTNDLIKSKQKINNEYYLDMVFKLAVEKKYKIKNIKVKSYYSWGTPEELINWKKKFEKKIIK
jgi:dTDP-glucose pyrophosphorylase